MNPEAPAPETDPVTRLHAAASLSQEFTIMEQIKAKFMRTQRDDTLVAAMDALLAAAVERDDVSRPPSFENRGRGSGLVLIGPTGVGKSKSLERYFARHPVLKEFQNPASASPLVSVSVPSPCTSMQLARSLLVATGYRVERDLPSHRLWEMALDRLQLLRKFIIHFDEMQHVVHNVSDKDLQQMADTLKNAMYNRRITLILSGVPTLAPFIQFDAQLFRRMTIVAFEALGPQSFTNVLRMLRDYAGAAQLELVAGDTEETPDFVPRLSHAVLNAFGYAIVLTQLAIEHALQTNSETLPREHFATVFARKTAFAADRNPFLVDHWHEIDCAKMFEKAEIAAPPAPARRRAK